MGYLDKVGGKLKASGRKIDKDVFKGYGKYINPVHQFKMLEEGFQKATALPEPKAEAFAPEPFQKEMTRSEKQLAERLAQKVSGTEKTFEEILAEQMTGKAPSIAELQMRRGMERSLAGQQAALAGARGVSPALAQRLAAQQGMTQRAELAQQAGIARLEEQRQAQAAYANELGMRDAMTRFYEAQRTGNFAAMQQAQQDLEKLRLGMKTEEKKGQFEVLSKLGQAAATAAASGGGG